MASATSTTWPSRRAIIRPPAAGFSTVSGMMSAGLQRAPHGARLRESVHLKTTMNATDAKLARKRWVLRLSGFAVFAFQGPSVVLHEADGRQPNRSRTGVHRRLAGPLERLGAMPLRNRAMLLAGLTRQRRGGLAIQRRARLMQQLRVESAVRRSITA
jgi:hypothetical protein